MAEIFVLLAGGQHRNLAANGREWTRIRKKIKSGNSKFRNSRRRSTKGYIRSAAARACRETNFLERSLVNNGRGSASPNADEAALHPVARGREFVGQAFSLRGTLSPAPRVRLYVAPIQSPT